MMLFRRRRSSPPNKPTSGKQYRRPRRRALWLLATTLVVLLVAAIAVVSWQRTGFGDVQPQRSAAIIDQLSLTAPNQRFVDETSSMLRDAGYSVAYYSGRQVTVELYRDLPARQYDLLILRVHSGSVTVHNDITGDVTQADFLTLFTGEPYTADKYQQEQDLGRIAKSRQVRVAAPGEDVFGIVPSFVERSMTGRFNGTAIIMMGCAGLQTQTTAQAFLNKGASHFVSWDKPVSSVHTDRATERLLDRYVNGHLSMADAVKETADEVGPDPYFGSELRVLSEDHPSDHLKLRPVGSPPLVAMRRASDWFE